MITDKNSLRVALREEFPRDHGELLPALHFVQHEFGYLPDWAMEVVGWHLGIPASEVYGGATSYTELRIQEPGNYVLRVCTGLSCWINGGGDLLRAVEAELRCHAGQTTPDGLVTLEETACGFMCGMAPALEWDGSWRGRETSESILGIIREATNP